MKRFQSSSLLSAILHNNATFSESAVFIELQEDYLILIDHHVWVQ